MTGYYPHRTDPDTIGAATKILQERNYAGVEIEYVHTGGGCMCLHWHTPEVCYFFGNADEMFGYQRNDPAQDCEFIDGMGGYATDVFSADTPRRLADWVVAVVTSQAPFEHSGILITDPTYDETRRHPVDYRTYWAEARTRP